MQLLRHLPDAEDAVQDAFARLWVSQASGEQGATLATYFNTIVINRCKTRLVQRREWATDPELLTPMADEWQLANAGVTTDGGHAAVDQARSVAQALGQLPARQRMALAMWAYADADAADIAHALDITVNAAHQLLHRARQALKQLLIQTEP
jgi:RNA polymerase sigma-70 factor, ECF subfamily